MDIWCVKYMLLSDLKEMDNCRYPRVYSDVKTLIENINYMVEIALPHYADVDVYLNEDPIDKIVQTLDKMYPDDIVIILGSKLDKIIDSLDPDVLEVEK